MSPPTRLRLRFPTPLLSRSHQQHLLPRRPHPHHPLRSQSLLPSPSGRLPRHQRRLLSPKSLRRPLLPSLLLSSSQTARLPRRLSKLSLHPQFRSPQPLLRHSLLHPLSFLPPNLLPHNLPLRLLLPLPLPPRRLLLYPRSARPGRTWPPLEATSGVLLSRRRRRVSVRPPSPLARLHQVRPTRRPPAARTSSKLTRSPLPSTPPSVSSR